ncbi:hypothetical protein [Desulfuromonas sp. TF]|uniref:hypothetical protein n=1 Tax=Desulfuromonas sp. TF TaxID=1232410 RepID=UPI0004055BB5|nr:hypothetical protein [Desulfuromonas sp. TF]
MPKFLPDIAGLFCLTTFLVKSFLRNDTLLEDGDPFWHIKAGSVMVDNNALLTSDIFSHTANGTRWISHEWLSEVLMALLHRAAGLGGVVCGALLLVSLSFWILFRVTRQFAGKWVSLLCVSLAYYLCGTHLAARPHLFSWFFITVTLAILLKGGRWLYGLPFITVIWANMHGGFIFGLLLQAFFISGSLLDGLADKKLPWTSRFIHLKSPLIVLAISIAASGINPFGFELLLFPLQVTKEIFVTSIPEWQSPDLRLLWQFRYFLIFLFLVMSFRGSSLSWTERLLFVFFINAALMHARNISVMVIILTPFLARVCNQMVQKSSIKLRTNSAAKPVPLSAVTGPLFTLAVGAAFIGICTFAESFHNPFEPRHILSTQRDRIEELSTFIDANRPEGNLFNEYNLGGYLLYAIDPPPRVFIDGRADMYGEQIFSDYKRIVFSEDLRESLLNAYEIDWIVFNKNSSIVEDLRAKDQWEPVFQNDDFVVLNRIDAPTPPLHKKKPAITGRPSI